MGTGPTRITDEQCDEFRRHPGTFNEMVCAIYEAGFQKAYKMLEEAQAECWKRGTEIQRLKDAAAPAQGALTDAEIREIKHRTMRDLVKHLETDNRVTAKSATSGTLRTLSNDIHPFVFARAIEQRVRGQVSDAADISYELMQDDMMVAGTSGKDALKEILHYAAVYEQDGPVEVIKCVRTTVGINYDS